MDIQWQNNIHINRPVEQVYAYLADFSRHPEWAQTLVRVEQVKAGDANGVGAQYVAHERQRMQADRRPYAALTKGMLVRTWSEVHDVAPNQRIAWHAHAIPNLGIKADLAFELAPMADAGTLLSERIHMFQPALLTFFFKLMFGRQVGDKFHAQADAGLHNIKTILEQGDVRQSHNSPSATRQSA